jgi:hypothetical protein
MNHDNPVSGTEPGPARFLCPTCGADSDAEDKPFYVDHPVLIPHTCYLLWPVRCETCSTAFDACTWLIRLAHANGEPRRNDLECPELVMSDAEVTR